MKKVLEVLLVVVIAVLMFAAGVFTESRLPILPPHYSSVSNLDGQKIQPRPSIPPVEPQLLPRQPKHKNKPSIPYNQKGHEGQNNGSKGYFGRGDQQYAPGDMGGRWGWNAAPWEMSGRRERGFGAIKFLAFPILLGSMCFGLVVLGVIVWGGVVFARWIRHRQALHLPGSAGTCHACGKSLQEGWLVCPYCATKINQSQTSSGDEESLKSEK